MKPSAYLEIGVGLGCSIGLVEPPTVAIGIDPSPRLPATPPPNIKIIQTTSDLFFQLFKVEDLVGTTQFSLAFIDGMHLFEQVLEDLFNLEVYAGPESIIAIHDTIPLNAMSASRQCCTPFYTGDVWKVIPFLTRLRPDLEVVTVPCAPSGLTLIRGFTAVGRRSKISDLAFYIKSCIPLSYFVRGENEVGDVLPNEQDAVLGWLRRESLG